MYRESLESHTDNQGRLYIETLMPENFVGKHNVNTSGLPIRLKVYDFKEQQQFYVHETKYNLKVSDSNGEISFVAYFDYYLENDGSITTGLLHVHPFHKNKKILTNVLNFFEKVIPASAYLNINEIGNKYCYSPLKKIDANKSFKINYPKKGKE